MLQLPVSCPLCGFECGETGGVHNICATRENLGLPIPNRSLGCILCGIKNNLLVKVDIVGTTFFICPRHLKGA